MEPNYTDDDFYPGQSIRLKHNVSRLHIDMDLVIHRHMLREPENAAYCWEIRPRGCGCGEKCAHYVMVSAAEMIPDDFLVPHGRPNA